MARDWALSLENEGKYLRPLLPVIFDTPPSPSIPYPSPFSPRQHTATHTRKARLVLQKRGRHSPNGGERYDGEVERIMPLHLVPVVERTRVGVLVYRLLRAVDDSRRHEDEPSHLQPSPAVSVTGPKIFAKPCDQLNDEAGGPS